MPGPNLAVVNPGRNDPKAPQLTPVFVGKHVVPVVRTGPLKLKRSDAALNIRDSSYERPVRAVRTLGGRRQKAVHTGLRNTTVRLRHQPPRPNATQPVLRHVVAERVQQATADHGGARRHLRVRGRVEENPKGAPRGVPNDRTGQPSRGAQLHHAPRGSRRRPRPLVGALSEGRRRHGGPVVPIGVPGRVGHAPDRVDVLRRYGVLPRHPKAPFKKLQGPDPTVRRGRLREGHVHAIGVVPQRVIGEKPLRGCGRGAPAEKRQQAQQPSGTPDPQPTS